MSFKVVYIGNNLAESVKNIKERTNWIQLSAVAFRNEDERIAVIDRFDRIRGHVPSKVYIDRDFNANDSTDFLLLMNRINHLGLEPVII